MYAEVQSATLWW